MKLLNNLLCRFLCHKYEWRQSIEGIYLSTAASMPIYAYRVCLRCGYVNNNEDELRDLEDRYEDILLEKERMISILQTEIEDLHVKLDEKGVIVSELEETISQLRGYTKDILNIVKGQV